MLRGELSYVAKIIFSHHFPHVSISRAAVLWLLLLCKDL